jgi:hypothetical protein
MKILLGRNELGYCALPYQTVASWIQSSRCRKVLTVDAHHSGFSVSYKVALLEQFMDEGRHWIEEIS